MFECDLCTRRYMYVHVCMDKIVIGIKVCKSTKELCYLLIIEHACLTM